MSCRLFDIKDDCEALTQFIFRCRKRGVTARALLDLLDTQSTDSNDPAQRTFMSRFRYAMLLALGEFSIEEIPEPRRQQLIQQLTEWYRHDPTASVHSAAGWLLRHWGHDQVTHDIDRTPIDYAPDREWFNKVISLQPTASKQGSIPSSKTFNYTFVVFPAGTRTIGRRVRQQLTLTKPFAILDREITLEELFAFAPDTFDKLMPQLQADIDDAGTAILWHESVAFCRWLGMQSGLTEADQAYLNPELDDATVADSKKELMLNWPLDISRRGFRLPTSAEWEVANRAGMRTDFAFGSELALLDAFGWYAANSDKKLRPPRLLRPNLGGMFDIHGNALEWTNDWGMTETPATIVDPLGPKSGTHRTQRGGSVDNHPEACKSSRIFFALPTVRNRLTGFRLAISLPDQ